jgi:hypothetical protein
MGGGKERERDRKRQKEGQEEEEHPKYAGVESHHGFCIGQKFTFQEDNFS